ncbi:caspase family protein [Ruegeria atlantica]|uniref:caspase family protein n=1 Tax=Ruegeria atlantica TaxID=81569 RepID=UPI00147CD58F|nr:caspase family protein [Ruegeria atlantica]
MIRLLLTILLLSPSLSYGQAAEPRLLVFAAGIENYEHPELDKLEFAADDAKDIFERFSVVANLDEQSELHLADDADGSHLTEHRLRNAVRSFARKIRNNDTVVVYLGGHGTLSSTGELLILPSDYDPVPELNYLEFDSLREILEEQISGNDIAGVKIAFIVNVCGAGNAAEPGAILMNVPTDDRIIEEVARLARELSIGEAEVAVIPATPRGRNTFEQVELGRSIFAKHMIDALDGAAAGVDGLLTTGEIIGYVETALKETLPRNDGFATDIVLGQTSRQRGSDHLKLGTALMGAAWAVQDSDISQILNDLALFHFDEVRGRNPEQSSRAHFRSLQLRILGRKINSFDAATEAETISRAALAESETEFLDLFSEGHASPVYASFADYLDALEADPDARILVLKMSNSFATNFPVADALALRFGRNKILSVTLPEFGTSTEKSMLLAEAGAYLGQSSANTPPLVVYSGSEGKPLSFDGDLGECELIYPWDRILAELRESNGAPFVFVFDAPCGGILKQQVPKDQMLLLTAGQPNGMTFTSNPPQQLGFSIATQNSLPMIARDGTSSILFKGILEKRTDAEIFEAIRLLHSNFNEFSPSDNWTPGEPLWQVAGSFDLLAPLVDSLAPLSEVASMAAQGCLDLDLATCVTLQNNVSDFSIFGILEDAARADMAGDIHSAAELYERSLAAIEALPENGETPGQAATQSAFDELSKSILSRMHDLTGSAARRVIIAPVGVETYLSPLIGDVPHALKDLEAYVIGLEQAVRLSARGAGGNVIEIEAIPALVPTTAEDIRRHISDLAQMTTDRPNDVILLVFSGRGDEQSGRRYLVTAGQEYISSDSELLEFSDFSQRLRDPYAYRFDLAELTDILADRWVLAIYDTQFFRPVLSDRRDVILEKHLYSSHPQISDLEPASTWSRVVPVEPHTLRQVHLWVDGRLTQAMTRRQACDPGVETVDIASPFAAAILRTFAQSNGGTYREFLRKLEEDDCIGSDRLPGSLVMQGDVDLPVFASGDGARFVQYFRNGQARIGSAVQAASYMAQGMLARHSEAEFALTAMALELANARLARRRTEIPGRSPAYWLAQARQRNTLASQVETSQMKALYWEINTRVYAEGGEFEQAREKLRAAPLEVLAKRGLSSLLIEFAEGSLRTQPIEVLTRVGERLEELEAATDGEIAGISLTAQRLEELILAERNRLSEGYRIRP